MQLRPDQYIDGRWITRGDTLTPHRVEPLTDLTHDVLSVSYQLASTEFVPVYLITGEVGEKQHSEVTALDWLRRLVRITSFDRGCRRLRTGGLLICIA